MAGLHSTHKRCSWCNSDPLYIAYHDNEWGVPDYDSRRLFEKLLLDGAQAGLSWLTILKKREGYRQVFDQFDPAKMAAYSDEALEAKLQDSRIVRNRLKVFSARQNAKAFLEIEKKQSFSAFLWSFVDNTPIQNQFFAMDEVPAQTEISINMSKALKKAGFSFVGPTIVYAFMQAVGMVNDHLVHCPRHAAIRAMSG